tara:strand:+ start:2567 stop:2749 length:183 start_codon:yes stop_codon:yes gene_type:complete
MKNKLKIIALSIVTVVCAYTIGYTKAEKKILTMILDENHHPELKAKIDYHLENNFKESTK